MANLLRSLTGRGKGVIIIQNQDTNGENSASNKDVSESQKIDSNIQQKLQNWSLPKLKTNQVYKTSILEFKPDYEIQTVEKCVVLQGHEKNIAILDSNIVNQHKRNYQYVHFGLVQVAAKPLARLRSEFPIVICLRDRRFKNFHQSVIQVLESNLQSGPAYFNCFANYEVSLRDRWITQCLLLDMKVPTEKLIEGTPTVCVMYRFCDKVSNKPYGTRALRQSKMNETTVIEVNAQMVTQKRLEHDQVSFPEEWLQERSSPSQS